MTKTRDVVVIGAGVIGAAVAWRCAQRGLTVTTVDPDPGQGAWQAAAGMLAPITELHYTETPLLGLSRDSLARYRNWVTELTDATAMPTGFRDCGTVSAAWDGADLAALTDLHEFGLRMGLNSQLLTGAQLRELEPGLASGIPGGLFAPDDHQVDPRLLHAALLVAGARCGVRAITGHAGVLVDGDRVRGVRLASGEVITAGVTVLAAGAWSAAIDGIPAELRPGVRPVKGQTLRLRLPTGSVITHVVRGSVKGNPVYVVPRADGELVVGATSDEAGFDMNPRAGGVYELLRDAQVLLPELSEAVFEQVTTRLRPGSRDNAPLIGRCGIVGLVYATGHYRNGILLAPVTADSVAELIADDVLPAAIAAFSPTRFRASGSATVVPA